MIAREHSQSGLALISVLLVMSVLLTMLAAYSVITRFEAGGTAASIRSTRGFYAAEGGLNVRAEQIRMKFTNYEFPHGESPIEDADNVPCQAGNDGSDDLACVESEFDNRIAQTYVIEDPANPYEITVPPGERYQNLSADEYRYSVVSRSVNAEDEVEAILELRFKSRLVPMFQFAAFYNKDLEINNGPDMALAGPIHTNGDLYLGPDGNDLAIYGQITTAGTIFRGRKDRISSCHGNVYVTYPAPSPVNVATPSGCTISNCQLNICSGGNRREVAPNQISKWNGLVQTDVPILEIPEPERFDPLEGAPYWESADLRIVLQLNSNNTVNSIQVREPTGGNYGTNSPAKSAALLACTGSIGGRAVGSSTGMLNRRESSSSGRILLEVDTTALLNCLHSTNWLGEGKRLDDDTQEGLVFYFTVQGPNSSAQTNRYGFRVRNSETIRSNIAGAPAVRGLTIVSDQAAYVRGHWNRLNWIPTSFLVDSFNVLSTAWVDAWDTAGDSTRQATNTTIQAAILSGTDTTGGPNTSPALEGIAGQSSSSSQTAYNGGLENYPRFHEVWSDDTFTYRGSFVSLNRPRHVSGVWVTTNYAPPARDWQYDTRFNDSKKLPPMSPRFVYLRQELFLRDFDQS